MSEGWHERIATEAGVKVTKVEEVLARQRIRSRLGARPARKLRVASIIFTGEKRGKATGPIAFTWSGLRDGAWAVASEGTNLVGKSSVLEIMLWALRGDPKGLQATSRSGSTMSASSSRLTTRCMRSISQSRRAYRPARCHGCALTGA
jgi:hypothetical protein